MLCHASPPSQPLPPGPAALPGLQNPHLPKAQGSHKRVLQRGRTTEKQWPKIKHVPLQEWPDPGRAPDTEALSQCRPHTCEGKGTQSRACTDPAAVAPSPLQSHNCLKSA